MAPMYILATQISPMRTTCALKLRCIRTYEVRERRSSEVVKCRECVFHDIEGNVLHAHIPREHVVKFQNQFVEGKVYCLKNFLVVTNFYTYKTSNNKFMVKFNYSTIVKQYKNINFPRHMFRLKSFKDLKAADQVDEKELIDFIGRIVEIYSPIEKVIAGRPSRLIDFLIEDANGDEMKCTVWDDHVDKVDSWVKSCYNTGDTKISSSYDATQIFINEDIPEIHEFRERICGEKTPLRSICSMTSLSAANTLDTFNSGSMIMSTITDVYDKKQYGDYWVVAKIVGIEGGLDWCYNSCKTQGCSKKLTLNTKGFYDCYKCNRTWAEGTLRYRIKVRVVDRNGNAPFLIWDRECRELIGMSAADLRDKYPQENQLLPNEILSLCSMTLIWKIAVRKEQFDNLHNAFGVMKIINDTKLIDSYCPELLDNFDNDPTSKLESNDCFESDEEFLSEGEAESPLAINATVKDVVDLDSGVVKRSLLDEFSSTKNTAKKMLLEVKLEKTIEDTI
ncbi:replication protein A 70 kDa DNA-binding subunit E-like [Ipomoea triloba]|uniref:replication protein A 70 kDa DNA-binding subunit E-like n=1 Tax=Ipomoea triloba TaxID=35885 RepID=UPI00125D92B2|nr:replication protein A 70 kDa DNA-binding subunit E-like [Ipomoea triloba]